MLTRRRFAGGLGLMALGACAPQLPMAPPLAFAGAAPPPASPPAPSLPAFYGAIPDEPFPVPAVPEGVVHPRLWRQEVANPYPAEAPGTIVVDPSAGYLHLL
jgi:hypothetical protein